MIEGTSNPFGSIWVANLVRRMNREDVILPQGHRGGVSEAKNLEHKEEILRSPSGSLRMTNDWNLEALVFSTNFRLGFDVEEFQTVLPKNLIHHMLPGEPIYDFFEAWKASAAETSAMKSFGARQWFMHTAEALAKRGYKVNLQKKFLSRGYLIWEL